MVVCPPVRASWEAGEEENMGKRSKTGVLKRLREVKKAEKAAHKREEMRERKEAGPEAPSRSSGGAALATEEDLAGYGFPVEGDEEAEEQ